MAFAKIAVLVAIICSLLQCVNSRIILGRLRVNDLPKGKRDWNRLKNGLSDKGYEKKFLIPAADLSDIEGKIVIPFEFGKLWLKNRKPVFSGKLGKRTPLKGKLSKLAKRKSAFVKGRLANIGNMKSAFSKDDLSPRSNTLGKIRNGNFSKGLGFENGKIKNKLGNVLRRRLLATPKLTLDGKLTSQQINLTNGILGSKGVKLNTSLDSARLFKNNPRQRLADKLGLGSRFQFFDGRRGIFDRTNGIFDLKKVNPLDMLDGKLANLNARFGKAIGRIHNRFSKKIDRLNLSPVDVTLLKKRLDKALEKVDLEVAGINGALEALNRVTGKVEDIVGKKRAFVDSKLDHIGKAVDGKFQLPAPKYPGAKKRSLLGEIKLGGSRLGGGLKLRNGLSVRRSKGLKLGRGVRFGGGLKLGGGLKFGRSKLSLDRPKLSFRRFRRIGGPKIDSRSAAAIADVIIAGINTVAPVPYSGEAYRGRARRLQSEPRTTLFQRLSLKDSHKPGLSFTERLAQKVNQKLGGKFGDRFTQKFKTPKSGRLSALLAGKFGKSDGGVNNIADLPMFNHKFGGNFGKTASFDGKIANIIHMAAKRDGKFKKLPRKNLKLKMFDKSLNFPGFDFKRVSPTTTPIVPFSKVPLSTEAPVVASTNTVAPTTQVTTFPPVSSTSASTTASAASKVASTTVPAGLADAVFVLGGNPEDASLFLSGMEHDDISRVPGTDGLLFAIELLEAGGSVGDATEALMQRNDMSALKTLMDAVKQAAMRR